MSEGQLFDAPAPKSKLQSDKPRCPRCDKIIGPYKPKAGKDGLGQRRTHKLRTIQPGYVDIDTLLGVKRVFVCGGCVYRISALTPHTS